MKIALIGLGDIARKAYLPLLSTWPGVELVLCTRSEAVLQAVAQQYRVTDTCTDYHELMAFGIDAVMIHAATAVHAPMAEYFLQQGCAVFVDKPLADSYATCEQLYDLAQRRNVPLYVGFNRRHLPLLNEQIPGLQVGQGTGLTGIRWEKNRYQQPGAVKAFLFDDFIHPLDSVNLYGRGSLDDVQVHARFDGQALASIRVSWQEQDRVIEAVMNRQAGQTRERIVVEAINESWVFDGFQQGIHLSGNRSRPFALADWTPMLAAKGFDAMIADWLTIAARTHPMTTTAIERNLGTHRMLQALLDRLQP
ncbi:Gfo/Idh/MocA family protein [Reinekea blandensis]|uniref:Oxidoreductase, Gfo/Idh/MocA family protein n=1 Tax=Reinekea blandensis MED297 TaxID=314283 RepID=A4B8U9_9GAMM|nr:Gfo/Idh/MocA family oxidoreductase [Reinekea blandensis]EAR11050.1 oxidoreductase, Gfo/Idh/MocA family protein [Reinekea sp. MED297] [Reinekea blandensis MED297]